MHGAVQSIGIMFAEVIYYSYILTIFDYESCMYFRYSMSIVLSVHPGVQIRHPGGQTKTFLPFGHGRDLAAFNGTGLQNKSFQDRAEISKA